MNGWTNKLMTLPPINSQPAEVDPLALVKFVDSESKWQWYGIEFDGMCCFGLVIGIEEEFGMFSLSELEEINALAGYERITLDETFVPTRISELA